VNLWLLAVLAAIVMPLDLAPAAFVRDRRIPERLRQVLTAESGLTDGIVAPLFLFCLAAATAAGNEAQTDAAIDAGPAWVLHRALRAGWTQPSALRLGVLALPLLAYAGAVVLGGNPGRSSLAGTGSLPHSLPASSSSPRRVGYRPTRCTSSRTSARCAHWRCGSSSAPS
jgi:NhaP-type Na+/H+ or K+/H+ antiporter